jgi:hypothetical protein
MKMWWLVGIFVASGVATSVWFKTHLPSANGIPLTVQSPCDLQQGVCHAQDAQGHGVSLQLTPHPIPLMKPVTAQVVVQGMDAVNGVMVVVQGVNMDMGFQRAQLIATQPPQWSGAFTLPVCANAAMQWQATVTVQTPTATFVAPFLFTTQR